MSTTLKKINALPVPTWRRMGVNGAELTLDLPQPPQNTDPPQLDLPYGAEPTDESVLRCAEFRSALSGELAAYTRVHANGGVRLRVKKGRKIDEPIVRRFTLSAENPVITDSNVIFAEAHSEVTVVLIYDGAVTDGFHAGLTRVIAENCALVRVVQVQTFGAGTRHFSDFSAVIANGARVELTRIELGADAVYAGCDMKLEGDKAESRADTFYFGDGTRTLDFNYLARHLGRASRSEQNASGALFGDCDKIYRGTIDFLRGASGSRGAESETTLLFSKNARNRAAPLILCGEESVEGSHAASVGRIDERKLYYMRSRGISETEAKRLMVSALMEAALKSVPLEDEKERLREILTGSIQDEA
jgi:Fe-S cluster assembly scaffold protein SufB